MGNGVGSGLSFAVLQNGTLNIQFSKPKVAKCVTTYLRTATNNFYQSVLLRFINVEKLRSLFVGIRFTMCCYALYFSRLV